LSFRSKYGKKIKRRRTAVTRYVDGLLRKEGGGGDVSVLPVGDMLLKMTVLSGGLPPGM
jgi:hypothetical protein